jgi:RNA polymerase sigma-70 factor (ECF subfamily)
LSPESDVEPSDEALVERARGGDRAAFELLLERYDRLVFRVVAGFGGGREEALDLTQTVFLKAWNALAGFRADAGFKTWLLRIAHHEALNRVRTASRRPAMAELDPDAPELAAAPAQESELLARERAGCVRRALALLHGRYRSAILLRYRDGLPIREIAGILDVSETMTKNLLFRGVRQLRRALAEAG